jgi:hypothetical protein
VSLHVSPAKIECEEAKMGALVFVCPTSGREVSSGVEIDAESYKDLPKVLAEILCPVCGCTHNLYQIEAWLVDGEQNSLPNPNKRHPE